MKKAVLIALAMTFCTSLAQAQAVGDAAKGEQIYKKCLVCHVIADKANKVGPSLLGIVDQKAGAAEGFKYSEAFKTYAATGVVWVDKTLDAWLTNPKAVVKGTKMVFVGMKNEQERADVIAYLKSKK